MADGGRACISKGVDGACLEPLPPLHLTVQTSRSARVCVMPFACTCPVARPSLPCISPRKSSDWHLSSCLPGNETRHPYSDSRLPLPLTHSPFTRPPFTSRFSLRLLHCTATLLCSRPSLRSHDSLLFPSPAASCRQPSSLPRLLGSHLRQVHPQVGAGKRATHVLARKYAFS